MAAPPWSGWLLLFLSRAVLAQHTCIHDTHIVPSLLAHEHFPLDVPQEPPGRRLGNTSEVLARRLVAGGSALRIFIDFSYLDADKYLCTAGMRRTKSVKGGNIPCKAEDALDKAKKEHIKKVVNEAKEWFTKTLRILRPPAGLLNLRKYCYQYVPPPNGDADTGINTHCFAGGGACDFKVDANYYLTVTANPSPGQAAYALACQNDKDTGRPIAGLVNIGPATVSLDPSKYKYAVRTVIHEISHAFGFSASSYDKFVDAKGVRLGKVVREFQTRGKTIKKIITPRVVEAVKRQYGCFDWPDAGGELEDHSATTPSHWEKRTFRDEYMTSTDDKDPVISAVTLALFEDTGWYVPDYSAAEHLKWGHASGCTFPKEKCDKWDDRYFCVDKKVKACTHNRFEKAYCNVKDYESALPVHSRYFPTNSKRGGTDEHADFCPFYRGFSTSDCRLVEHTKPGADEIWGELNGASSRCFDSTIISEDYDLPDNQGHPFQRCYPRRCKNGKLIVYVDAKPIECPRNGGIVTSAVEGFEGTLWCPPATELCDDEAAEAEELLLTGGEFKLATVMGLEHVTEQPKVVLYPAGPPVTIKLAAGETLYMVVDLSVRVTGDRELLFEDKDLHGDLYARVEEEVADEPVPKKKKKKSAEKASQRRLVGEKKLWPSKMHHDSHEHVNGVTRVELKRIITESSSSLLLAFSAPDDAAAEGRVYLRVACPGVCANGGVCSFRGVCQCPNGFGGLLCKELKCPNDCSGQGSCDTVRGICSCNFGFEGENCMVVSETDNHKHDSGEVPVGAWAYFFITCDDARGRRDTVGGSAELTYVLEKDHDCPLADPFLFAGLGREKPTETIFAERALISWKTASNRHVLHLDVRTGPRGGATIGIYNSAAYGKALLKYKGEYTCTLKGQPKPCPRTTFGECNGKGNCVSELEENANVCKCSIGWAGKACDERKIEMPDFQPATFNGFFIHQAGAAFIRIVMPEGALHKNLHLAIKGVVDFMCISVNAGVLRPKPETPRSAMYHNFWSLYEWEVGKDSEVTITDVNSAVYTVMVTNPSYKFVEFDLQVSLDSESPRPAVLTMSDETEEPQVPLNVVGPKGNLPDPLLMMSSRTGVEGVASSARMRLLTVNEFCTRSRTGLYVKCSSMEGTMSICTDKPAVAYHEALYDRQPKDISEFRARKLAGLGTLKKNWAHLRKGDACNYLLEIKVTSDDRYVGVAALKKGQYVNFLATMKGKATLFFNDAGGLRDEIYVTLWCLATCLCTTLFVSTVCFGFWHRKASQREHTQAVVSKLALRWASVTRHHPQTPGTELQPRTSGTELTVRQST